MSLVEVVETLRRHERFLVSSHVNGEGDSIGSQLAMAELLRRLGKQVWIINETPVPSNLRFLPGVDAVQPVPATLPACDAVVTVDVPVVERLGRLAPLLPASWPIINIDHHISNKRFGAVNWVDPRAAAAGEMVYRLFKVLDQPLTYEVAVHLYVAMMTDTGSFRYSNTTAGLHHIISELVECGVEPARIYTQLYETRTLKDLQVLSEILRLVRVSENGKIAWLTLTPALMDELRGNQELMDLLIDFPRSLKGVQAALLIRPGERPQEIHVSLRSKGLIDVNAVAQQFGGGGHSAASGCVLRASIEEAERRLLTAVREAVAQAIP